jgi:ATP phosphoribosyltransferase
LLTFALPKGRLADESIDILIQKKFLTEKPKDGSKELIYTDKNTKVNLLFVRSQDVPTYIEECAADIGIVGWDVLLEGGFDLLYPHKLDIGKCRLSLAAKPDFELKNKYNKLKVATKYPNLTKQFFFSKGLSCEIIKLYGSIELAPLCGLADCIVDLVSTGETLRANGLQEKEIILESTARITVNRTSLYTKRKECIQFLNAIK